VNTDNGFQAVADKPSLVRFVASITNGNSSVNGSNRYANQTAWNNCTDVIAQITLSAKPKLLPVTIQ